MENSQAVEAGNYVLVDYTVTLEDGIAFDTTVKEQALEAGIYDEEKKYTPLFFRADARQVIKGLDRGVLGMKEGEEKTLIIPPVEAYGEYKAYLAQDIPLERLELQAPPEVGEEITTPGGRDVKVLALTDTHATLDFNHELAGKTLIMKVKLVSVIR
ncbi:peptidylprolyl isomerase [Methanosarcina sp. KYL-1]|uniref:FKBP-type peptidyl-prolyl cis-trans isomerase n=1 Tax=Methanosarcina sp. KYL-1 TaxID=2602068 RepID=UPI0021006E79|nr:peptidylprolyl isomerase [Methanosarcina sp. KYL-1]MCQ1536974.1 peptidylprolyl isomerase [Methanosarcina sp. KYL-1]